MKRILGILVLLASIGLVVTSCKKEDKKINANLIENTTIIKFEREIVDFGKLNDGEKVTCSFKFKNAGKSDLIISSVSANCGCTVADYPREPISPGEEGQITVTYDSSNSSGLRISKEISVLTNTTPPTTTLRVVADIL
ncbi:MAG: DUF1573 domain-containing protein [Bacteroidales bacterium]|jgi:hypothetical protein|nr:DUF1573 domain-containing protein [Bacteroidales bacterium]